MSGLKGPNLAKRINKLQVAVEKGRVDAVKRSAEKAKAAQLAVMRSDSGGDLKLSGVNKRKGRAGGATLNVNYRVRSSGMTATALIKATGPLQIIDGDTSGHVVRSAYGSNTRGTVGRRRGSSRGFIGPVIGGQFSGGRKAVLNIPGVGFRRTARHPGTKGKDTWKRGRKDAEPKVATEMKSSVSKTIAQGMKG